MIKEYDDKNEPISSGVAGNDDTEIIYDGTEDPQEINNSPGDSPR